MLWDHEIEAELQRMKEELRSGERNFIGKSDLNSGGLDTVLEQLNNLVGMQNVKDEIDNLINFLKIQKLRQEKGLAITSVTLIQYFVDRPELERRQLLVSWVKYTNS